MSFGIGKTLRGIVRKRILGVRDTPHRIAFGVFLGLLIGWTPTLGFQIVIYVAVATLLRANKVSGVPLVFISNPLTAGPLYYFAWRVGSWLVHWGAPPADAAPEFPNDSLWDLDPLALRFWSRVWEALAAVGVELWLGSLAMGLVTGVPAYFITRRMVRVARERREGEVPDHVDPDKEQ